MSKQNKKIKVLDEKTGEYEDLFIDSAEFGKPYTFSRDREIEWLLEQDELNLMGLDLDDDYI